MLKSNFGELLEQRQGDWSWCQKTPVQALPLPFTPVPGGNHPAAPSLGFYSDTRIAAPALPGGIDQRDKSM